jgi:hypothetical protein
VDVLWGSFVWKMHPRPQISSWVIVNQMAIVSLGILLWFRPSKPNWLGPLLGITIVFARTAFDYWLTWSLYFPS